MTAELALDRTAIGDPALMNLILVGDNYSLSTPGAQQDLYPDTVYDANASIRKFSYKTGGLTATTATTPLIAAALSLDSARNRSLQRFDNAIQASNTALSSNQPGTGQADRQVNVGAVSVQALFLYLFLAILSFARRRAG